MNHAGEAAILIRDRHRHHAELLHSVHDRAAELAITRQFGGAVHHGVHAKLHEFALTLHEACEVAGGEYADDLAIPVHDRHGAAALGELHHGFAHRRVRG